MARDNERVSRITLALELNGLDAVVCSLPGNVLLLTGYWPVVGTAIAVATAAGRVGLVAPRDEKDLVERGWADEVVLFDAGSLDDIQTAAGAAGRPFSGLLESLGLKGRRVGVETGPHVEPCTYVGMHFYRDALHPPLRHGVGASLAPADEMLAGLRSIPTPGELARIRAACTVVGTAYEIGRSCVRCGLRETEIADGFREPLARSNEELSAARSGGFTFCMSGPNSAGAYAAYARSAGRRAAAGDFLLLHCNSYVDGYWTDVTRTYCVGEPGMRQGAMYEAVFAAREAALAAIRPGAYASAVDAAAREALEARDFGHGFKHATGHGVGFAAIDHNARPRIHPESEDVLEAGMVFNVEPAIYIDGFGGLRHCDMVAVTALGGRAADSVPFISC